jgi:hypothetical protein
MNIITCVYTFFAVSYILHSIIKYVLCWYTTHTQLQMRSYFSVNHIGTGSAVFMRILGETTLASGWWKLKLFYGILILQSNFQSVFRETQKCWNNVI